MPLTPAPPSAAPAPRRPRAGLWLVGAAALALAVQAVFLLVPEPKSAGATDPAAPEAVEAVDSTAFLLEDAATALPGPAAPDSATGAQAGPAVDSTATNEPAPLSGSGDTARNEATPPPVPPLPDSTDATHQK